MTSIDHSNPGELPSRQQLVRSTLLALFIAAVLLVTVVLPAEYGIDPTGIGRALGLTAMGEIKASLAREEQRGAGGEVPAPPVDAEPLATAATAATPLAASPAAEPARAPGRTDETTITLRPGEGKEIKLRMREGARVKYSWATEGGVVNYDRHADSVNPRRDYHGYGRGTAVASDSGEMTAAFDGSHGWFWRNRGRQDVRVTLHTEGDYADLAR